MNEKLVSTKQCESGNLTEQQKILVREINENPSFDPKTKPYKFIKKLKSNTDNHGWIFIYKGKVFIALKTWLRRLYDCVIIYPADDKGKFESSIKNEIVRYPNIVDIEYAVDKFVKDYNNFKI